nr:hypothetical protein [Tanacetum cinerariifolium]
SFHITFAMSTQQDIYAADSESRPPMLNKENYVPWSSRLLRMESTCYYCPSDQGLAYNYTQLYDFLKYNQKENSRVQNVGNQNGLIGVQGNGNHNQIGNGHYARNRTVRPRRRDAAYLQTQLLIAQKEEAGIQLQAEEYDLMAASTDLDEIKEVNANCILMANLQQASTSGTQTDNALVYDSAGSAENNSNAISEVTSVEQCG